MPFDGRNFEQKHAVLDLLRRARERVAQPGGWCQGLPKVGAARCAAQWLFELADGGIATQAQIALQCALPKEWDGRIILYNDARGRTQEDIVALYDRAIAL